MRLVVQGVTLFRSLRSGVSSTSISLFSTEKEELTREQKDELRQELSKHKVEGEVPVRKAESLSAPASSMPVMDEIRARGFLPYKYSYTPPSNVRDIVDEVAKEFGLTTEGDGSKFGSLDLKAQVLLKLGTRLRHFVLSSKLHYIQSVEDAKEFYSQPIQNITGYAKLARNEHIAENVAIREHPIRFHPCDRDAVHRGVTAYPGEGGKILGLRNQRIYRQFRPKQEWFDYEEQTFDHEPVDKNMPWDPKIAEKMDRYVDRKFKKDGFYKIK